MHKVYILMQGVYTLKLTMCVDSERGREGGQGHKSITKTHEIKENKQIPASTANTTRLHSVYTYNYYLISNPQSPAKPKAEPSVALKLHSNTQSETH